MSSFSYSNGSAPSFGSNGTAPSLGSVPSAPASIPTMASGASLVTELPAIESGSTDAGIVADAAAEIVAEETEATTSSSAGVGAAIAGVGAAAATATAAAGGGGRPRSKHNHHLHQQTFLTKALLKYLSFFRIVQPLVSLSAFATITPVLSYFRSQTVFPTIQATLYLFTATLACCSLFFSILYMVDVLLHKPLFWPFTNRHFRQTSRARIGGDLIVCMGFCGLWFLSLVGLVIDTLWVDCGKVTGLEPVFWENQRVASKVRTVCRLEKATLGLAVVSWICWMGVLLVLLYGHFWKRRQIIAARLRESLSRRSPSSANTTKSSPIPEGVSSAVSPDAAGSSQAGSSSLSGRVARADTTQQQQQQQQQHHHSTESSCQDREGEVGLTGVICHYDDDQSSLNTTLRRGGDPSHSAAATLSP